MWPLVVERLSTDVEHGGVDESDGDERVEVRPLLALVSIWETRETIKRERIFNGFRSIVITIDQERREEK